MDIHRFRQLVEEALVNLSPKYTAKLSNVAVVVEDEPTEEQRAKLKLPDNMILFGLYEGVPQIKRGSGYTFTVPDKITIFKRPLEAFYQTEVEIKTAIRETVLHEIGHHFGLSEMELTKSRQ